MNYLDHLVNLHGVPYRFANIPEGYRGYLMDGAIILNETLTPERANWAYCHELAHLLLEHPSAPPTDQMLEIEQENEANLLASQLLLPDEIFASSALQPLTELKKNFPFASYEVLARRRLHFRPGLLSIFDNGKLSARLAPEGWNCPTLLYPLEQQALRDCYALRSEANLEAEALKVEATFVDEGRGVLRVILFLEGESVD